MGRARILIVLAIATIGSIGLVLVVSAMIGHKAPPPQVVAAQPSALMARVLVARHDLAVGARLTSNDMTWQDWPVGAINPAFVTDGQFAPEATDRWQPQSGGEAVDEDDPFLTPQDPDRLIPTPSTIMPMPGRPIRSAT